MSKEFTYTITDPVGIHARPAGKLVKMAQQFESDITLDHDGNTANAKHILGVMSLGIAKGDPLKVSISGADEDKAAEELETFFKDNL
ncbi:HPr family phosphocarrier protein [Bifidobacterium aquikefiricola]|uniref:HPr family phosphocarrier protein n=1 Tax=Bifidobacterium aquikefiricola TaxID=3059038 RepID=A0AB39U506_9BIFI